MVDAQLQQQMTLEDYLALPESNQPMEFIDGEIVMAPAPTPQHQIVSGHISFYLRNVATTGQIIYAPADVVLGGQVLQPDIFWIKDGGECKIIEREWHGAPDLIIEILSPSTEKKDRSEKFDIYEQNGVGEYWLVSPSAEFVEVYKHENENFVRQGIYGKSETFTSGILLVEVVVKKLFGDTA